MARRIAPWPSSWITTPGFVEFAMTSTAEPALIPSLGHKKHKRRKNKPVFFAVFGLFVAMARLNPACSLAGARNLPAVAGAPRRSSWIASSSRRAGLLAMTKFEHTLASGTAFDRNPELQEQQLQARVFAGARGGEIVDELECFRIIALPAGSRAARWRD